MLHRLTLAVVKTRLRKVSPEIEVQSTHYKNNSFPLRLRCKTCGTRWEATTHNLLKRRPTGCPTCGQNKAREGHRLTFEEVEEKLNKKLILLSFENGAAKKKGKTNLTCEVKCKECGHEWRATLCNLVHNLKRGAYGYHGCPKCRVRKATDNPFNPRLTTKEVKKLFSQNQRGMSFIGPYTKYNAPFKVSCKRCNHEWMTTMTLAINPQNNRPRQSCPKCYPTRYGASEERVRKIIEHTTGEPFPKARPSSDVPWLKGMHLDGFNKKLGVAFEYQGYQHYERDCHFHGKTATERKIAFEELKRRDARKRFQCMYHGVLLICIPYWKGEKEIEKLVKKKLASR